LDINDTVEFKIMNVLQSQSSLLFYFLFTDKTSNDI